MSYKDSVLSDADVGRLRFAFKHPGPGFDLNKRMQPLAIRDNEAYLQVGSYSSVADGGRDQNAATWINGFFADDSGSAMTGDKRNLLARTCLTVDQSSAVTINAIRGQLKANDGVDISSASSVVAAIRGYVEFAGTGARTVAGHVACVRAALEEGASGTTTVSASSYFSGFEATLNSTRTYSLTGVMSAFTANISSGTSVWAYGLYLDSGACTTGIYLGDATTGMVFAGDMTTGVSMTGAMTDGINFSGTYTGNVIDFSSATIDPTGSGGPCFIRVGVYGTEVDYGADNHQSGVIRTYTTCSGDKTSYDRGIFACTVTTGAKGAFPIAGLAEANNTGTGPSAVQAGQFVAHLGARSSGATLTTMVGSGAVGGMHGIWAKVAAAGTAVCDSGSLVAPIWCDNQMSGTINGEEYGIYATTGASRPDGFIGFNTSSSGYAQLLYFDTTFDSGAGICVTTDAVPANAQDARILVWYDGLQYYLPLWR